MMCTKRNTTILYKDCTHMVNLTNQGKVISALFIYIQTSEIIFYERRSTGRYVDAVITIFLCTIAIPGHIALTSNEIIKRVMT